MTDTHPRLPNRLRPLAAAVLVVCLVVGAAVPAAGLLADSPTADTAATDGAASTATAENAASADATQTGGNASSANATASAGARLAGAIGTQQSAVAGELETRTLVVRLGRADSPEERAAVLAMLEARADARLDSLRERRERLRAAADNRSVSAGAYAYLAATVSVEAAVNRRLADRGERATADLSAAVTAEYGLSTERFRALANRSDSVTADLHSDLRALGRSAVADEIDADDDLDAEDILQGLNETVGPTNRTDWPFDENDSTLGDALDELGADNESLGFGDVIADDSNDADGPLEENPTDGRDSGENDTDGSDADDGLLDDGTLDGNVSDADGLIDGTDDGTDDGLLDDGTETPTDEPTGDDGLFGDDTTPAEKETAGETTDDGGLFDG
ncbi:hypothetical protein SAMN05216388_101486 [Halorientalis persicus]|uniref:Uncharacterized protein n=1 Tax=Halorientalis persicus TaxID=1367881 RepID=A0A1H8QSJ0_9EURY|nr:hypothetical protein [Halorientalis persicus]SEO56814.1 hypothetical protein SAMN05216388_101486 [Halorientalis persicus]